MIRCEPWEQDVDVAFHENYKKKHPGEKLIISFAGMGSSDIPRQAYGLIGEKLSQQGAYHQPWL